MVDSPAYDTILDRQATTDPLTTGHLPKSVLRHRYPRPKIPPTCQASVISDCASSVPSGCDGPKLTRRHIDELLRSPALQGAFQCDTARMV